MIETPDYWLHNYKIIFKPEFNSQISIYNDLLCKYNELVFSNYSDVFACVETSNNYSTKYNNNYKSSKFNQPVILPPNLIHLTFGNYFNQLVNLPPSITHVIFGWKFNQPVNL